MAKKKTTKPKEPTFAMTKAQFDEIVEARLKIEREKLTEAIMELILALPAEVLRKHFWKKSYKNKLPEFTELMCDYYQKWSNGEIDLDRLVEELEDDAKITILRN